MSKTNSRHGLQVKAAILLSTLCFGVVCSAQTIDELAEAQRTKILNEIAAVNAVKNPVTAEVSPVKRVSKPPSLKLHSLYKVAGRVTAEVTDGKNLITLEKGMTLSSYSVTAISEGGVTLGALPTCKKACPKVKVVRVGGVF